MEWTNGMLHLLSAIAAKFAMLIGWIFSPSWLPPKDFELVRWLFVPGYGYGIVLVAMAILEFVIPQERRRWSRASLLSGTYLLLAGKMVVYVFVVTPLFRNAWVYLGLPSAHLDRTLPWPLYVLTSVLVLTFTDYWAHRGMHQIPGLWHIHKIHHSARNLNWTSIYHKHFLELLLNQPLRLITLLALGTDLVAPFGVVFMIVDVLSHSNIRLDLGRLTYLISTPQAHRIHHSINPKHYDTNFGNTVMIWDRLFGTFCYDPNSLPTEYGVDEDIPLSFWKQQVMPLVWIAKDTSAALSRRLSVGPRAQMAAIDAPNRE
jgi:sterol desaturase/sphingolipid hydroxylase (fatty acid hydroxylase superfamily)